MAVSRESEIKFSTGEKIGCGVVGGIILVGGVTSLCIWGRSCVNNNYTENLAKENYLMQEKGLSGERPIIDLREVPGFSFNGQIGGFLVVTGTFHGETTQMLQFAWKPKEDDSYIQISSVPTKNVKYLVIDNPDTKPTVLFTGMKPGIFSEGGKWNPSSSFSSNNINDYVDKVANEITIITLSKADWEKFRGE